MKKILFFLFTILSINTFGQVKLVSNTLLLDNGLIFPLQKGMTYVGCNDKVFVVTKDNYIYSYNLNIKLLAKITLYKEDRDSVSVKQDFIIIYKENRYSIYNSYLDFVINGSSDD